MNRFLIPFGIFVVVVGFLAVGLTLNPRELPSPLVGKAAPDFSLPQLHDPGKVISSNDLKGKVWLLNFWASWCGGCKEEHPVLIHLAQSGAVPIYGMDYKDQREEALTWLREWGNPYPVVAVDESGRIGINYGVYGVPETYVIDKAGIIRYKHGDHPLQADRPAARGHLAREDFASGQGVTEPMSWLLVIILLIPSLAAAEEARPLADNPQVEARLKTLAVELRCLVCQNQTLADSHAPLAEDLRREVREMIAKDMSDKEIIDFLVQRYGDFVLYRPPWKASTTLLWLGPFLLLIAGATGLVFALRRRQKKLVDVTLSEEEHNRVAQLLSEGANRP